MPAETHSHRAPVDPAEIEAIVRDRLAEVAGVDDDALAGSVRLRDDLGLDDLALLDLVEVLEEELGERTVGFRLDDEELAELATVQDAVDCIRARVVSDEADDGRGPSHPPGAEVS